MSIASHLTLTLTRVLACVVAIITLVTVLYSLNAALQYPAAAVAVRVPAANVGPVQTANHTLSDRPNRGEQWYMTRGQPERSGRR